MATVIFKIRGARPMGLATRVAGIDLAGPAMLASGILGISMDVFRRLLDSGAGAVVSKSLSAEPREGYPNPTMAEAAGGWLNAVGLSNPGAPNFANMMRGAPGVPVVVSLVGSDPDEFVSMARLFEGLEVPAFELNLSCPHVEKVGLEVGDDPELVSRIVRSLKGAGVRVIAKVGLGSSDYLGTVRAAEDAGADAVTAINTVRAMSIDVHSGRPVLSNGFGGLSGPPIRPIAVRCVREITSRHEIPVIGCGGVSCWEDAAEFLLAGASAVQVGTAAGGNPGIFAEINSGISSYMERRGYSEISEVRRAA